MNGLENRPDVTPAAPLPQQQPQAQAPLENIHEKSPEDKTKETADPWDNFDAHAAFLGPTLWDKRLPYDGQDFKVKCSGNYIF
jgi:hypothetical protein